MFQFQPRWKEELVVTGPGGTFVLELPMGVLTAYLPTENAWQRKAPPWASGLWAILRAELSEWCEANKSELVTSNDAGVF
jgi:hypothetical protein